MTANVLSRCQKVAGTTDKHALETQVMKWSSQQVLRSRTQRESLELLTWRVHVPFSVRRPESCPEPRSFDSASVFRIITHGQPHCASASRCGSAVWSVVPCRVQECTGEAIDQRAPSVMGRERTQSVDTEACGGGGAKQWKEPITKLGRRGLSVTSAGDEAEACSSSRPWVGGNVSAEARRPHTFNIWRSCWNVLT